MRAPPHSASAGVSGLSTMRLRSVRTVLLAVCVWVAAAVAHAADTPKPAPAYVVKTTAAKRVKVKLAIDVTAPRVEADEWTVYAALIPELPGQVNIQMTLQSGGRLARELSDAHRPMLYERIPAASDQEQNRLAARLEYEATLLTRKLERRDPNDPTPPPVAPLDPATRRRELASVHQFDHKAATFQAWLDEHKLRRERGEDDVDFARRAFGIVRKNLKHYEGENIQHNASKVCAAGKSDFAGLTATYVSVLRTNGIPARLLCGFPVIWEGKPSTNYWTHGKSEFYALGVGWVPADLAGAIRTNSPDEGLDFFGNDRADFLTAHVDTDLIIDTYFGQKTLEWLPDISWWVKGSGSFDGTKTKYTISVKVEPLDLADVVTAKPSRPASSKPSRKKGR